MSDGSRCRWVYRTASARRLLDTFRWIHGLANGYRIDYRLPTLTGYATESEPSALV